MCIGAQGCSASPGAWGPVLSLSLPMLTQSMEYKYVYKRNSTAIFHILLSIVKLIENTATIIQTLVTSFGLRPGGGYRLKVGQGGEGDT